MRNIIVSVGTSLLTNRETVTGRPWIGWSEGRPLPSVDDAVAYLSDADPELASAETNTLDKLNLLASDCIHWLHSDTEEGFFCAEALCHHYESLGNRGELHRLHGLRYSEDTFAERGLRSLVSEAFDIIRRAASSPVEICATGGFKAETAYLNLVGMLTGCPVHYIHERLKQLITFPALPATWDASIVERNRSFFQWIEVDGELRSSIEVEQRLNAAPELRMLVTFDDEFGYLSPAGVAMYEAYRASVGMPTATWPPASPQTDPRKKIDTSSEPHHLPRGTRELVERLANINCVSQIRYCTAAPPSRGRVTIVDPQAGLLRVAYSNDFTICFEVETTATGEDQCRLVADYIKKHLPASS